MSCWRSYKKDRIRKSKYNHKDSIPYTKLIDGEEPRKQNEIQPKTKITKPTRFGKKECIDVFQEWLDKSDSQYITQNKTHKRVIINKKLDD